MNMDKDIDKRITQIKKECQKMEVLEQYRDKQIQKNLQILGNLVKTVEKYKSHK